MRKLAITLATIAVAAQVFAAGPETGARFAGQNADEISTSFARMLEHEPYYGPTAGITFLEDDPLAAHVYAMLRNEPAAMQPVASTAAAPTDETSYWNNVAQSFHYMLNHQPYAGPTSGIARSDHDPLEAAIHAALWTDTGTAKVAASSINARLR